MIKCVKYKKKLIFSSSREVYGDAEYIPVDEEHPLNQKKILIKNPKKGEVEDFIVDISKIKKNVGLESRCKAK